MTLGKNINSTFDHVYLKNILEANKRRESFINSAANIELEYEIYTAVRGDIYFPEEYVIKFRPELYPIPANQYLAGNHFTWLSIHLDAMRKRYDSYVTCDDDTIFENVKISLIKEHLPKDWDILILGDMERVAKHKNISINFIKLKTEKSEISGCHCVAINKSSYYKVLDSLLKFNEIGCTGDCMISYLAENNIINLYKMYPNITYQERTLYPPYSIE